MIFLNIFNGLNNFICLLAKKANRCVKTANYLYSGKYWWTFCKKSVFLYHFRTLSRVAWTSSKKNCTVFETFFYVSRGTVSGRFLEKTIVAFCTSFLVSERKYPYFRKKNMAGLPKLHYTSPEEQLLDNLWKEEHLLKLFGLLAK